MTVDQFAIACRVDSSNVRVYESGRGMPNIQTLVRIDEAHKVTPGAAVRRDL